MSYLAQINKLRDALISSNIGHQITKMVWFGSTQKRTARKDSDVDILIITKDGRAVRDRIADLLLDFQMHTRLPVEIVTSSVDELYPLTDHFLKNVLTHGQEVYSMPEKDLRLAVSRTAKYRRHKFATKISKEDATSTLDLAKELSALAEKHLTH